MEGLIQGKDIFDYNEFIDLCKNDIFHYMGKASLDGMSEYPLNCNVKTKGKNLFQLKGDFDIAVVTYFCNTDYNKIIISDKIAWIDIYTHTDKYNLKYRAYRINETD